MLPVARPLVQFHLGQVGRIHVLIAGGAFLFEDVLFQQPAHGRAFGQPERQARAHGLIHREQFEFFAQPPVVAPLGFLQPVQVLVQFLLGEEGGAVDALQLLVVLVAFPIGAGDGEQLEGFDLRGVGHVRPAAEIDKVRAEGVFAEDVAGALGDQLALHPGVGVFPEPFFLAGIDALVGEMALLDLPHFLFDLLEVFGREGRGAVEIVIKAVLDGRTDAELGLRDTVRARRPPAGARWNGGRRTSASGSLAVRICRLASFSIGRVEVVQSSPSTLATMAASASRGLMDRATSMGRDHRTRVVTLGPRLALVDNDVAARGPARGRRGRSALDDRHPNPKPWCVLQAVAGARFCGERS